MIPRTLVPQGAQLPATNGAPTQRRRPTTLDERTLVPSMLPIVQLDGHSTIPKSLPLESIAARVVVPRDVSDEAYRVPHNPDLPIQPTELDPRMVIPVGLAAPETIEAPPMPPPADLVDHDVFMTGEVNLLTKPEAPDKDRYRLVTRVGSFAFHIALMLFILSLPKLFPARPLTQREIDLANRQLTWIPPESSYAPKPKAAPAPRPTPPAVHVDPKVINKVAPTPPPAPKAPERPKRETLPDAPTPKTPAQADPPPVQPKPDVPKPALKLDIPEMPKPSSNLKLPPNTSSVASAMRDLPAPPSANSRAIAGGGRISGRGAGQSGSGGTAFGGLEMLTPDQGVDFNSYLQRVYLKVKQNWFAVMPESVELGERGVVVLTFKIMRDGGVPSAEPVINHNSGKEPLDRAAYSSIRASNPFEPLPSQFSGPYIELRYTYLYNIPIDQYFRGQ
jgi:outer membrane biosynthesis protein TonB